MKGKFQYQYRYQYFEIADFNININIDMTNILVFQYFSIYCPTSATETYYIPNQWKFNRDFRKLFIFEISAWAAEIIHFKLVHFFMNKCRKKVNT